jgi:hypothetical protein
MRKLKRFMLFSPQSGSVHSGSIIYRIKARPASFQADFSMIHSFKHFGGSMKFGKIILWLLLIGAVLAACKPTANPPQVTTQPGAEPTGAVVAEPGSYPSPEAQVTPGGNSYPAPNPGLLSGSALYPDVKDGDQIDWLQAQAMISNGEVGQVVQTHALQVTLMLKDGRSLITTEPVIDEVMRVIEACGATCSDIKIATE